MAAGRVDVSRRRVSYDYSRKVDDGLRYTSHESRHRVYRRDCEISIRNDRGGRFEGRERSSYVEADEKKRITKSEDGVDLPPEKKRKFSPIIWNILEERKDVKATKSKVDLVVNSPSTPQSRTSTISDEHGVSSPLSVGEGVEFQPESRENCSTRGSVESSGSESSVISNLMATDKECCDDDRRLDKEECEVPKLSMSRWASDSPVAITSVVDDDVPLQNEQMDHSSPESGEFRGASMDEDESGSGYDQDCLMGSAASDEYLRKGPMDGAANVVELNGTVNVSYQTEPVEVSCGIPEPLPSPFQGCRSVFEYKKLNEISEGTYGKVYKAMDLKTGQVVALKKVKMDVGRDANLEEYGFPLSSLREINILMSLRHPSIVNVREVVMGDLDSVFLVMEYMEHELRGLLQTMKQPFSTSEVKCLMVQLLKGVKYLHDNWVLHRDLKTSNLLLNNDGELKICDFGMSRQYGSPLKPYTSLVVTLWYRAPELLLGAKQYSTAVDMWSVGCIMAELLAKEPLFKGRGEIDQLDKIFRTLGTPSEARWPGFSKLPGAKAKFVKQPHNLLRKKFPAASFTGSAVLSDLGLDLLNGLLAYNPEQRITAEDALNHPWFQEVPLPKSKELMPTFLSQCAKKR